MKKIFLEFVNSFFFNYDTLRFDIIFFQFKLFTILVIWNVYDWGHRYKKFCDCYGIITYCL